MTYIFVLNKKDGSWSESENLSNINTRYWKVRAIFPDMKYLYFVSDRRGGFRDDIWRSEITKFGFFLFQKI